MILGLAKLLFGTPAWAQRKIEAPPMAWLCSASNVEVKGEPVAVICTGIGKGFAHGSHCPVRISE
jgi:hypothetical protein